MWRKDGKGQDRNVVKVAVEPDHPDYAKLMGVPTKASGGGCNANISGRAASGGGLMGMALLLLAAVGIRRRD